MVTTGAKEPQVDCPGRCHQPAPQGARRLLRAVQAVLALEGVAPQAMRPQLSRPLLAILDRSTDAPLHRLSPREREVVALLGHGWSNAQQTSFTTANACSV
jgi:DNA-binding NarL/FixJ family response regulator